VDNSLWQPAQPTSNPTDKLKPENQQTPQSPRWCCAHGNTSQQQLNKKHSKPNVVETTLTTTTTPNPEHKANTKTNHTNNQKPSTHTWEQPTTTHKQKHTKHPNQETLILWIVNLKYPLTNIASSLSGVP
jgi:hypothetical protein